MPDKFKIKINVIDYPGLTTIACTIYKNGKQDWVFYKPLEIGITKFAINIAKIMNFDWDVSFWMNLEQPLEPAPDEITKELINNILVDTLQKGKDLYCYLSEIGFEEILNKVNSESMPNGTRLTIVTNCAFFPWEILNLRAGGGQEEPKDFWGYRFITNYVRVGTPSEGPYSTPQDNSRNNQPKIILNINPTINDKNKSFVKLEPDTPHLEFRSKNKELVYLLNTGNEIKNSLIYSQNDATMIYVYCHGDNDKPFQDDSDETLEVDEGIKIVPNDLRNPDNYFSRAPVVFLNSCKSGLISPLSFVSFLKMFQAKEAIGIIGTTINIPITFAAAFGVRILDYYLEGTYLAQALFELRRDLLGHNNPLGLFYSFQCPIDVSAPEQNKHLTPK